MGHTSHDSAAAQREEKAEHKPQQQRAANDSAAITKDVEKGAEPAAQGEDARATETRTLLSKLKEKRYIWLAAATILLVVGFVATCYKLTQPGYICLSKEQLAEVFKFTTAIAQRDNYPGGQTRREMVLYNLSDLQAVFRVSDYIAMAQMPSTSCPYDFYGKDIELYNKDKTRIDAIHAFLRQQVTTALFNDIKSTLGMLEKSRFATYLNSIRNLNSKVKTSVLARMHWIFTTRSIPYEPNVLLFNVLLDFVHNQRMSYVVTLYSKIAEVDDKFIKSALVANDYKQKYFVFASLQKGRLDGDVVTFATKIVVEMALAAYHTGYDDIVPSVNMAALFTGLNFSPLTGRAQCSDVKRVLPAFQCKAIVSFAELLKYLDQNDLRDRYSSNDFFELGLLSKLNTAPTHD